MKKRRKQFNPSSLKPKKCEIVETMTGRNKNGTGVFPSRNKAKKFLAKLIPTLPPRANPDEPDIYYIRNV